MFENYAIVATQSDNITFYACKIIKGTSVFNLKKTAEILSNTNNSTTLTPPGPQGCLEKQNHPLSWNLVVWWAKIGYKTKKL